MIHLPLHRALCTLAALAAAATFTGCGDDASSSPAQASGQVVVSAATSLKKALTTYDDGFAQAKVRISFAGSDALAAQIRQGVPTDVFASANTKLPNTLFEDGLVERPVVFATNRLVLAVPARGGGVSSVGDLEKPGVKIAIGAAGVPVGDYTRTVLGRLPAAQSKAVLANVRSNEPDVGGVVGKLTQGAVDAGFVYASDVRGAGDQIRAIDLPASLEPTVEYAVAVVKAGKNPAAAKRYIDGLLAGAGADALKANGFGPPPAP
jgi:molybdate transport system substrate-binding protein